MRVWGRGERKGEPPRPAHSVVARARDYAPIAHLQLQRADGVAAGHVTAPKEDRKGRGGGGREKRDFAPQARMQAAVGRCACADPPRPEEGQRDAQKGRSPWSVSE